MKRTKGPRPPEWVNPKGGQDAIKELGPLLAILYTLIEDGIANALVYFQERKKPVHNVVFATLVRLRVWEEVQERAKAAGITCRVVYKANVGVRVIYNGSTIAIWNQLVAPKGYESFWKSGLIHWAEAVPHPAKTIAATTDLASGAEELDDILKHKKTADEPRNDKS